MFRETGLRFRNPFSILQISTLLNIRKILSIRTFKIITQSPTVHLYLCSNIDLLNSVIMARTFFFPLKSLCWGP
jgi:hypothetical protein